MLLLPGHASRAAWPHCARCDPCRDNRAARGADPTTLLLSLLLWRPGGHLTSWGAASVERLELVHPKHSDRRRRSAPGGAATLDRYWFGPPSASVASRGRQSCCAKKTAASAFSWRWEHITRCQHGGLFPRENRGDGNESGQVEGDCI